MTKIISGEREMFWSRIDIPTNPTAAADGTAPVNPVTVADKFIESVSIGVALATEAEELSETIHDIKTEIKAQRREIEAIRRQVLSTNFNEVKASWKEDLIDAFVLSICTPEQYSLLRAAYDYIDTLEAELDGKDKRLNTLRHRYKMHVQLMDWARQYVDYDKYQGKVSRGMR